MGGSTTKYMLKENFISPRKDHCWLFSHPAVHRYLFISCESKTCFYQLWDSEWKLGAGSPLRPRVSHGIVTGAVQVKYVGIGKNAEYDRPAGCLSKIISQSRLHVAWRISVTAAGGEASATNLCVLATTNWWGRHVCLVLRFSDWCPSWHFAAS